jgi:1-deoxy-D-xylulose-5-phosphate reductoisomerase
VRGTRLKNIAILGSSGSIGTQTVEIALRYPEKFNVVGLAVHSNVELLEEQLGALKPKAVAIFDDNAAKTINKDLLNGIDIYTGRDGLERIASHPDVDLVINAMVGSIGLRSTLAAIKSGKTLALANKESMVAGGKIVNRALQETGAKILPVDSEHNAIFQCLTGERVESVKRLIITASGGPFRGKKLEELTNVTKKQALDHPRWTMGPKITIDSATLMNKGLEVIEARWLFDIGYEKIDVVVHPQSIIHSMVEYEDGSIKAHLGQTDMRIPIQYALSYPERLPSPLPMLDFVELGKLTFEKPDLINFPCLAYAYESIKLGKTYPAALNAANEEAVAAFLKDDISFLDINRLIGEALEKHKPGNENVLEEIFIAEKQARENVKEHIKKIAR